MLNEGRGVGLEQESEIYWHDGVGEMEIVYAVEKWVVEVHGHEWLRIPCPSLPFRVVACPPVYDGDDRVPSFQPHT